MRQEDGYLKIYYLLTLFIPLEEWVSEWLSEWSELEGWIDNSVDGWFIYYVDEGLYEWVKMSERLREWVN